MRRLTLVLTALILALQWPLWFGKGSVFRVWQLERQLSEQNVSVQRLQMRNNALAAEVRDLKIGTGALEERSRVELGMIRKGEIFFQILDPTQSLPTTPRPAAPQP